MGSSGWFLEWPADDSMATRARAMADEAFAAIGYPATKLATILNRADSTGGVSQADVEGAINRRIDYDVVSHGRLLIAANHAG